MPCEILREIEAFEDVLRAITSKTAFEQQARERAEVAEEVEFLCHVGNRSRYNMRRGASGG